MRNLFLLLFILFGIELQAQIPGYFGKKYLLGMGTGITPCVFQKERLGLAFSPSINLNAEVVLSRKLALFMNIEMGKQNYGFPEATIDGRMLGLDRNTYYSIRVANHKVSYNVGMVSGKTLQISGVIKLFKGRFISPVGRYFMLGGGATHIQMKDESLDVVYSDIYPNTFHNSKTLIPAKSFSSVIHLTLGLGKTVALSKNILLDLHVVSNIKASSLFQNNYYYFATTDDYIYQNMWKDLRWREALQFNINLKYALF